MSRSYNMLVKVNGFDPEKIDRITTVSIVCWMAIPPSRTNPNNNNKNRRTTT